MKESHIEQVYQQNQGIFRLKPVFVPRRFGKPGRRLRLHPDDYYPYGILRGAIKERWFSSVIRCMNGENAGEDEGLSYVDCEGEAFTLKEAVELFGSRLIGDRLYEKHGTWPMYSKFFDYEDPLFFHLHLDFESAARVGHLGKPESYYYPPQYNNYPGTFPHTYFGLQPGVTREMVRERLVDYEKRDTRITELSRAYRIELGSGWYTPPGVLHAPGSYLTYEPQWNSDVNSVYENITAGEIYPIGFLNENCPPEKADDVDYILDFLDWDKNTEPDYKARFARPPIIRRENEGFIEKWVCYGNDYIASAEVTVYPGREVVLEDDFAYGCILTQGHGEFGGYHAAASEMLRFGQRSEDEYFVGIQAAEKGVRIRNASSCEPLVLLKHFPANEHTPKTDR